jgi:DNA polymerase-3 subunit gamma/tau
LEIDAASHRGIEEIRELREAVKFAPTKGHKKIYIIDEVHMLTRESFNALLKTLEEPPPHTVFIMATTEPHKVPPTIVSRSQHFVFRRATVPDLVGRLRTIARAEGIPVEEDALKLLASVADGSFRNAETALEQVWSAVAPRHRSAGRRKGKTLTAADVQSLLGLADRTLVLSFLRALAQGDASRGLAVLEETVARGVDLQSFLRHALDLLRALLLVVSGEERLVKQSYTDLDLATLRELATHWGMPETLEVMEKLLAAGQQIKVSPVPELPLEMVVAAIAGSVAGGHPSEKDDSPPKTPQRPNQSTRPVPVAKEIDKVDEEVWRSILAEVKAHNASLYSILKEAMVLGQTSDGIALGVRFRFHAELLSAPKHQVVLSDAVTKILGRPAQLTVEVKPEVFSKQEEELLKMAEELL